MQEDLLKSFGVRLFYELTHQGLSQTQTPVLLQNKPLHHFNTGNFGRPWVIVGKPYFPGPNKTGCFVSRGHRTEDITGRTVFWSGPNRFSVPSPRFNVEGFRYPLLHLLKLEISKNELLCFLFLRTKSSSKPCLTFQFKNSGKPILHDSCHFPFFVGKPSSFDIGSLF